MTLFPEHASEYAKLTLEAIAAHQLGHRLSVGGGFGLLHYLDYRPTHDVDAWWAVDATTPEQEAVLTVIEVALSQFGEVRRRVWGEVVSIELLQEQKVVFSFQIARRSAQLQVSTTTEWVDVQLDSLADVVAGKMVALVERGAPRDFRDIYQVCHAGLTTPKQCWRWWEQRQTLSESDVDHYRAGLAVETHLARISQHRPLDRIEDSIERTAAQQVRTWFQTEFLDALSD